MEAEAVNQPADTADDKPSTGTELVRIETDIEAYKDFVDGLNEMLKLRGIAYNLESVKGNEQARKDRAKLKSTRVAIEKRCADKKRELKASLATQVELLEGEADRFVGIVQGIYVPIDEMIEADESRREREKAEREAAEAERTAAHRDRIADITAVAVRAVGMTSEEIAKRITMVTQIEVGIDFEEFQPLAVIAKAETLEKLSALYSNTVDAEAREAQAQRDREELARLQQAERERQQAEAEQRAEQQRVEAEQRRVADEQRAAQQRAEDARRAQSDAANNLVEEIRRIQRRAITASSTGMLELLTLVENIRPGDELGDFVGVVLKAKDDAIADLHELHEQKLEQERQRLAQEKQRRADEDQARQLREARERNDMIMQQIEALRQQTVIARVGRNPHYTGGNAADVTKIIAETEAWVIDAANFDGMVAIAQTVKDAALVDLRDYLAVLKTAEADAAREAEIRREQESSEGPSDATGPIGEPLQQFESVQISGADTQSVELTPAPIDDGLGYLLDVGMDLGAQREVAMYRLLSAVVDVVKAAKRKAVKHWTVPAEQMALLQAALRAVPLPTGGYYSEDGTLMTADGNRSVFDDVEK